MNVIMYYSPFKKIATFNVIYGSILVFVRFIQMCKLLVRYLKKTLRKAYIFIFYSIYATCKRSGGRGQLDCLYKYR